MIDGYDWAGGREAMLRFGPAASEYRGPVVVAAMPLLEEWNRTRAFVVTLLRALADHRVASVLPDLPGHGESLSALPDLGGLRAAMAAAVRHVARPTIALGVRSGALLDAEAPHRGRWYLSPMAGDDLLRDLERVRLASGGTLDSGQSVTIAGTAVPRALLTSLAHAEPMDGARVVRLAADRRPADRHVDGAPLWRKSEPGNDVVLAALLAQDVRAWISTCVVF